MIVFFSGDFFVKNISSLRVCCETILHDVSLFSLIKLVLERNLLFFSHISDIFIYIFFCCKINNTRYVSNSNLNFLIKCKTISFTFFFKNLVVNVFTHFTTPVENVVHTLLNSSNLISPFIHLRVISPSQLIHDFCHAI